MLNVNHTVEQQFQEGVLLADNNEFERANQILLECVMTDPACVEFVDEFLANLMRKFGSQEQTPQQDTKGAAAKPGEHVLDQAVLMRIHLRQLATNPWHIPTLLAIAEICESQGYYATELRFLQQAWEAAKEDLEVNRRYGKSLARAKRFAQALVCWEKVEQLNPADTTAPQAIAECTIQKSRQQFGFGLESAAGLTVSGPAKKKLPLVRFVSGKANFQMPERSGDIKRTPIQRLEFAIREHPVIPEYYLQLAPLYLEVDRDYDAEKLLAKGRDATDDEPRVRQLWEEVTMMRLEKKIAEARLRVEESDSEEAKAALADACEDRDRLETQIFVHRCEREPENAALRYELGRRLKQAGKTPEACKRFTEAMHDPEQKCFAAFELAECLRESHDLPEAFRHYRLALESAVHPQHLECKKQTLFQLGQLAQRVKLTKLANRYFADLAALDPHYRIAKQV